MSLIKIRDAALRALYERVPGLKRTLDTLRGLSALPVAVAPWKQDCMGLSKKLVSEIIDRAECAGLLDDEDDWREWGESYHYYAQADAISAFGAAASQYCQRVAAGEELLERAISWQFADEFGSWHEELERVAVVLSTGTVADQFDVAVEMWARYYAWHSFVFPAIYRADEHKQAALRAGVTHAAYDLDEDEYDEYAQTAYFDVLVPVLKAAFVASFGAGGPVDQAGLAASAAARAALHLQRCEESQARWHAAFEEALY